MTHSIQSTDLNNAVQLLADNGFEGMASAIQILFNEAMNLERNEYIGAEPYQRRVAQTIPEGCLGAVAQEALSPWPLKFEPLTSCGMATQTTRNELSEQPAKRSDKRQLPTAAPPRASQQSSPNHVGRPTLAYRALIISLMRWTMPRRCTSVLRLSDIKTRR